MPSFTCDLALTSIRSFSTFPVRTIWDQVLAYVFLVQIFFLVRGYFSSEPIWLWVFTYSWCRYFFLVRIFLLWNYMTSSFAYSPDIFPLDLYDLSLAISRFRYFCSGPIWLWVFAYSWCRYLTALNYGSSLPTLPWTACEESRIWILENFDFWAGVGI